MKLGLLFAAALAGCSAASEVDMEEMEAITGGSADRTHEAVVAIDIAGQGLCSGTLVAPNAVLTARHCVSHTSESVDCAHGGGAVHGNRDPRTLTIHTGEHAQKVAARGAKLIVPKKNSLCGYDAAVIVLDQPIKGIKPLHIGAPPKSGYVTVVGFGRQGANGPHGARMKRRSRLLEVGDMELKVGESSCPGDSGGPALSAGGAIVGIVSRGSAPCDAKNATNIFTRADAHEDLLQKI